MDREGYHQDLGDAEIAHESPALKLVQMIDALHKTCLRSQIQDMATDAIRAQPSLSARPAILQSAVCVHAAMAAELNI